MKPLTRLQVLEKQNKDLRVRLENRQGKSELALCSVEDEIKELRSQLDARDKVIAMLQAELASLTDENEILRQKDEASRAEIDALMGALDKAEDRAAKLEAMLKKDSTTSSKPPSTDNEFAKAKAKSGKERSGKKPGGQPGHKGHRLEPSPNPDVIVDRNPPAFCPCCDGEVLIGNDYEPRQAIDVEVIVTVTEERLHSGVCAGCGKVWQGEFSEGFKSHVGYGPSVKTMAATLNVDANVPVNKTATFISSMTDGKINMSDGTVVNIVAELAKKLAPTVQDIILMLASCGVLNIDETGMRVNGKLSWMHIISNDMYSLFGRNLTRGTPNEVMNGLILLFTGVLVHDHLSSYYKYTHLTHAECNAHILRYLKAVTEIMKHPWAQGMAKLLADSNKRKKELVESEASGMEPEELDVIRNQFTALLDQGQLEYDAATAGKKNITYYAEERRLLARLRKFMDEHLLFLANFDVPFDNNGAEQGARHLKSKLKTAGCFRSDDGIDNYATNASVFATLRKHGRNIYSAIKSTFLGDCPRFVEESYADSS
jgi:transposase